MNLKNYIKIKADYLNKNSVSILTQEFEINNETNEETQIGLNHRRAFVNSEYGRIKCQEYIKNFDETSTVFEDVILPVWGDNPTIIPEPVDIDKLKQSKQQQIKNWCHNIITKGIDIDLGFKNEDGTDRGSLHYTLTEQKQTDMRDLMSLIATGAKEVTWRDDSRLTHEIYTVEQFTNLYQACTQFIFQCRFRSDGLEELLFRYDTEEDINNLNWNTELPEDIQNNINQLLSIALSGN